ncbi:MAG: DUF1848 domain-containing protein [Ktedonobacteraceae bacterium]
MIISASYKTDIPTFYGEWFINRLRAGYCKMVNPYGRQVYKIDLSPEAVDGFVFWTKNIGPFLKYLPEIRARGYPFIVQHTINGYPHELEFRVIDYTHTIEHMKKLAGEYGPDVAIWRYDPIIVSSLTPVDWHQRNFETLARSLKGTTNEVVVSFAQIYKKTRRNMVWASREFGFTWSEHEAMAWDEVRKLVTELAQIAGTYGMQLRVCSQQTLLVPGMVEEARCVDADRLERVSSKSIVGKTRQKGNRKECGCFASKDIGEYDTCPHGCVYCYAVQNRELALQRSKAHDPMSEFLFAPEHAQPGENGVSEMPGIIPMAHVGKKNWLSEQSVQDDKVVQEHLFDL